MKAKVNCDASVWGNDFIGIDFVLRDLRGDIGAGVNLVMGNISINCAEAIAIQKAMEFSLEIGCAHVIVESDNMSVIQCLNSHREYES